MARNAVILLAVIFTVSLLLLSDSHARLQPNGEDDVTAASYITVSLLPIRDASSPLKGEDLSRTIAHSFRLPGLNRRAAIKRRPIPLEYGNDMVTSAEKIPTVEDGAKEEEKN